MPSSDRSAFRRRALASLETMSQDEADAIARAAAADPDNPRLLDEDFARMRPAPRGRPKLSKPKIPVTLRIDADVVERFRSTGKGWQSRMNEALRKAAG